MDSYTADTGPFEEDALPPWLRKQHEDAAQAEAALRQNAGTCYREGERVGLFIFVRPMRFKNRAVFACPECGKRFQYNIYAIKNKRRCKWYRGHAQ